MNSAALAVFSRCVPVSVSNTTRRIAVWVVVNDVAGMFAGVGLSMGEGGGEDLGTGLSTEIAAIGQPVPQRETSGVMRHAFSGDN